MTSVEVVRVASGLEFWARGKSPAARAEGTLRARVERRPSVVCHEDIFFSLALSGVVWVYYVYYVLERSGIYSVVVQRSLFTPGAAEVFSRLMPIYLAHGPER